MKQSKKYNKTGKHSVSDKVVEEADKIANGIKKPGQSKEQTKLVSQGIQKGIEIYKKQQKSKARDLDKQLKKAKKQNLEEAHKEIDNDTIHSDNTKNQIVPWSLLALSWIGFVVYITVINA